ncbi:dicarboxylate transporter/tellurite-resistance protein TehA [Paraburkholderia sp. UCT31]|uniref:dicarboxylate transporter/tellurite-resistance protein TehA n=1 Tax=Paraburkholderia sp. UCT31 TaxID=2615209 RepID=UPI0016564F87|nr:dicarboxylate transporter/tellurite-resistance protein TehA [Paraburkholderia sp. UCT31]MBC8740323.1 dicarboxylate transporter/tellurite-resistance protein TehA [Paraburkholderia sp. UCT31]
MSTISVSPGVRHFSVPASSFGIVLGMAGFSNCWRFAHVIWGMDARIGDALSALTAIVWLTLLAGYAMKWWRDRDDAMTEFEHPIQCCFIGLVPVSTSLVGMWVATWSETAGTALVIGGAAGQLGFSTYRSGALLRGGRSQLDTTAVMYLPTVAGNFVSAIALSTLGYMDAAKLFFGAGLFSWLALESVITHRLYTAEPLARGVRPTLGIQLAPPAVASVAYLSITHNSVDMVFLALFGYAVLQLLLLSRLLPWFMETGFSPAYWAFSFGGTAFVLASMRTSSLHAHPLVDVLALPLFVLLNLTILSLFIATVRLLLLGKLFMK